MHAYFTCYCLNTLYVCNRYTFLDPAEAILTGATEQLQLAEEGRNLGSEVLKQCIQRQEEGTVVPFELMQAQENYIQAQLDYLRAVAKHNKAQYKLHVIKGNDL